MPERDELLEGGSQSDDNPPAWVWFLIFVGWMSLMGVIFVLI